MATVNLTPPQEPLPWKHTPEEIRDKTNELIRDGRKFLDTIAALPEDKCSFDSVFRALALHEAEFDTISEPLSFYQNVSPDSKLRDASNDAEKLLRDFGIESSMRLDVFQALKRAEKNARSGATVLTPEEERLMEKMLLDGKRAGLDLPDTEREKLLETKKKLSETCLEFSKNFNEEKGTISFSREELKGLPEDVISGYAKTTSVGGQPDKYSVTFKTPDIFPIFKFASNPLTRQLASEAYENRLTQNVPLLKKAIDLRWEIAKMLGYETWADYIVEVKMIKTSPNVVQFLDNLVKKMKVIGEKDRATLLKLKEQELGDKTDGKFYIWDYRYYDRMFIEKSLDLDEAKVKEYFPVDVVVPAILKIYQDLLGVSFVEITKDVDTWHQDVQVFQVWNKDPKSATDFLGYTYLDLFPRESKYGHAAVWPLISGFNKKDGSRNYPVTAMVANLAKPVPGKTATMRHDDVVTFFHEMGHVFHGLLSNVAFSRFHGTSVARDFVEAPSQMLENWCWEPKVLKMMSKHVDTGEQLSDELIDKLIKSRYVNAGLYFLRQLFFGKFDMELHTKQVDKDYDQLWSEMRESISLVKSGREYTAGPGTFAHITGGYDAGYYGYMYSLVFSADMYKTIFAGNPLSPESGKKYRDSILKPGGSRDEMNSLKEFLGREPNPEAFLESLEANQYKPATVPASL
ncbi:hypothetical protein M407DRAFT_77092 [Tulasnella calospora MUT 4182]|uniref:Peptidase M3A/M3B catalytic domain-containing protein n=1 Tax=Tulasnella calospora MUT 4182 TaxID=1051891 RepID=A0A0C3LSE8_9AGAM|nr:hypothetical protein M407DRAFT_77092 [Tulasnella calospora MUT 4182]